MPPAGQILRRGPSRAGCVSGPWLSRRGPGLSCDTHDLVSQEIRVGVFRRTLIHRERLSALSRLVLESGVAWPSHRYDVTTWECICDLKTRRSS